MSPVNGAQDLMTNNPERLDNQQLWECGGRVDLDTATLRALTVLAEELHFGRTAARLQITQQAVSKRIQRLETLTGGPVVDRSDRLRVRLTNHGVKLVAAAREVLDAVDRLPSLHDASTGRLRVDVLDDNLAPMSWARRAAGPHSRGPEHADDPSDGLDRPLDRLRGPFDRFGGPFGRLGGRAAGWPVDVVTRPHDQPPDVLLRSGQAHLAFGRAGAVGSPWPPGLRRRLVLLEPLSLLLPPTHRWAGLDEIGLAQLRGQAWWFPMTQAPHEWRELVTELSRHAGITLDATGSTFGYRQWAADVSSGAAPPSLFGEAMAPTPGMELTTVPIVDPVPVFPWWLLWYDDPPSTSAGPPGGLLGGSVDIEALVRAMGLSDAPTGLAGETWMPATDAALLSQPPGASSSRR